MKKTQTKEEAIESVKNGNINYHIKALGFAIEWVKIQMKPFTSEELKNAFYALGNEPPGECRIWGSVILELKKLGLITANGFRKSTNPICHGRPQTIWLSKNYQLKQQQNRKQEQSLNLFEQ